MLSYPFVDPCGRVLRPPRPDVSIVPGCSGVAARPRASPGSDRPADRSRATWGAGTVRRTQASARVKMRPRAVGPSPRGSARRHQRRSASALDLAQAAQDDDDQPSHDARAEQRGSTHATSGGGSPVRCPGHGLRGPRSSELRSMRTPGSRCREPWRRVGQDASRQDEGDTALREVGARRPRDTGRSRGCARGCRRGRRTPRRGRRAASATRGRRTRLGRRRSGVDDLGDRLRCRRRLDARVPARRPTRPRPRGRQAGPGVWSGMGELLRSGSASAATGSSPADASARRG